jgi:Rho-binding antiterminator
MAAVQMRRYKYSMSQTYKTVDPVFRDELQALVAKRAAARIQFYTAIHEFMTRHATLKELVVKADGEYLVLTTGEEIRLDRLVRIGDRPAPGYDEDYFKCD